jgi:putative glycosyltransferase (TIGR04348 family)
LKISIVTPAAAGTRHGNRNTAVRWARLLRESKHRVRIMQTWDGSDADLLIALHARRSASSVAAYAGRYPGRPLVLVLTGTDLYRDIETDADAQRSLELATRLVVLQDEAPKALPRKLRGKVRVIYQSAPAVSRHAPLAQHFEALVSGHLRAEKDPFRAAAAAAYLPATSRIRVTHIGRAMTTEMEAEARRRMSCEPRYRWLGERSHAAALRLLARSRVLVISSIMEGGANVASEALACGVPVIASRIPGNVGMFGRDYPGYYPVGNERALAKLLARAETDAKFYRQLEKACAARRDLVTAKRERRTLEALIAELSATAREPKEGRFRRET